MTVTVEPPEISGNVSDEAIDLTCMVTIPVNAETYRYQLNWYFNEAPIDDQLDQRIMV